MKVCRSIADVQELLGQWRAEGHTIGFVPTMGALHPGHLSLITLSRADNTRTIVSIYVNPAQFGPKDDFGHYPRPIEADIAQLEAAGADALYLAQDAEMYPSNSELRIELPQLGSVLEGASRPGHFAGVTLVVTKLLNILQPNVLYLGRKDYQQTVVLRKLVRELFLPVQVKLGETIREADGLAMSSRNAYLSPTERQQATILYRCLTTIKDAANPDASVQPLLAMGRVVLAQEPQVELDHLVIVDGETLKPIGVLETARNPVVLIAAKVGTTRLLDNIQLLA
jgi:pantoate--beta-alanine ligase